MFIVIEGPDGSGKSSLADAVCKEIDSDPVRFHKGKPESNTRRWVLDEYATSVELFDLKKVDVVADRWHWGEVTYAPIKRPTTNKDGFGLLGRSGWRWVELFLSSRGVSQFFIDQPTDVIKSRLISRGDDFVNIDELDQIIKLYSIAQKNTCDPVTVIRPADGAEGIKQAAKNIVLRAKRKMQDVEKLFQFPEYIGSPEPDVLLVGDRRNNPGKTILPFMPIDGNSGEYLMSALPEKIWRTVGIINAGDIYGERLFSLWDTLGKPPVVALGREAERQIYLNGIHFPEYAVLPHPQYVRRFHHHDKGQYGLAIAAFSNRITAEIERYSHWILP